MRVLCETVDDFFENICVAGTSFVFQGIVYFHRHDNYPPQDKGMEKVVSDVFLQLSTVIDIEDGGQYLLNAAVQCGRDYNDSSQEKKGTEKVEELRKYVSNFCQIHKLKMLPGIVDF